MRIAVSLVTVLGLAVFGALGCESGSAGPDKHLGKVTEEFKSGNVSSAYTSFIPASYDKDLNDVLGKFKQLITEEEFKRIQTMLGTAGDQIAPLLAQQAAQDANMKVLADKLKDPLKALGLESYSTFSNADIKSLLKGIEDGLLRELLANPDAQKNIGSVAFEVVEEQGENARLKVTQTREGGATQEKTLDVVKVDGKWVPAEVAADWPTQMQKIHAQLDQAIEQKKQNPAMFSAQLDAMEQQLGQLGAMLPMILKGLQQLGGDAGAAPGVAPR